MDFDEIKKIVDLMAEKGLTEFEMEREGTRLILRKGVCAAVAAPAPANAPASAPVAPPSAPAPSAGVAEPPESDLVEVKAPFVGTFYRAPAPDAEPYVVPGQEVGPETVLCIVEAMKVMNEIKAEMRGILREVLVENALAVQFGQPLFRIQPL